MRVERRETGSGAQEEGRREAGKGARGRGWQKLVNTT